MAADAIQHEGNYRLVVVKVGTSTLTRESGRIDLTYIAGLIDQIAQIRSQGTQVVLVSSGAITAGLEVLGLASERPDDMATLQAAAAIGQVELARQYAYCAASRNIATGQVLITRHDTSNRTSYLHARNTILRLLELGALPIVNENDTVAIDEIKFGDNDTLAATVATLIGADLVVMLSDIDGLYTADPRKDEDAQLLEHVGRFTAELVASAGGVGSKTGSGGMATKVEAARVLMRAGVPTVIAEGRKPDVLLRTVSGESMGTLFEKEEPEDSVSARKLWIALGDSAHGSVQIDEGARTAIVSKGASLLPVGVIGVSGPFEVGDVIDIRDVENRLIGRGISGYSSRDAMRAAGKKSAEIEADDSFINLRHTAVIHRDEMIIF